MAIHLAPMLSTLNELKSQKGTIGVLGNYYQLPKYDNLPAAVINVPVSKVKISEYESMTTRLNNEIKVLKGDISSIDEKISSLKKNNIKGDEYYALQRELNRYNAKEQEEENDLKKMLQTYNKMIEEKESLIDIKLKAVNAIQNERAEYEKKCAMEYFPVLQKHIQEKINGIMEEFKFILQEMEGLTSTVKGMNNVYQSLKRLDITYESEFLGLAVYSVLNEYMAIVNNLDVSKHLKINSIDEVKQTARFNLVQK